MSNPTHLAYIYGGRETWNNWRATSKIRPDLRGAPLGGLLLAGYNFSGADCQHASFYKCDLSGCEFGGANLGYVDLRGTRLTEATFSNISFHKANLAEADFSGSQFETVDFSKASLGEALFKNTKLRFCEFVQANLVGCDFHESNLQYVSFLDADVRNANFSRATLCNINLNNAWIWDIKITDWALTNIDCRELRTGRNGEVEEFDVGDFEKIFATRTMKVQLPDGRDALQISNLQNLIYLLRIMKGSFSATLFSDGKTTPDGAHAAIIKIEPRSNTDYSEIERLNEVIKGMEVVQKDKEVALDTARKQVEAVSQRLLSDLISTRPTVTVANLQDKERVAIAVFDLTGSSAYTEDENLVRTTKFWALGLSLVVQMGAKHVNTWGDSLIACFEDDHIALDCAWELIAALRAIDIQCRAGMHHGTVRLLFNPVIGKMDIAGPAVHLAARLEPLAEPGTVIVSEEVKAVAIARKLDAFEFKNKEIAFQKGAGKYEKGDKYLASIAIRKNPGGT